MTEIIAELQKGGVVMIPLLLGSIITLAIVIERAISLRPKKIIIPEIVTAVERIKCPEDIRVAESICETHPGTFANVMLPALRNKDLNREELKEFIIDQGRQEVRTLERGLVGLETIAGVAPLLGLMGTVVGMIKVFNVISQQGLGQANVLSQGISEALITTVTGLAIGIPALIAYNFFTSKAEGIVMDIEKYTASLLHRIRLMTESREETESGV
jgi:biopolymer transport protein ExbB